MSKPYTAAQLLAMSDEELAAFMDRQLECAAVRAALDDLERAVEGVYRWPSMSNEPDKDWCRVADVLRLITEARERAVRSTEEKAT